MRKFVSLTSRAQLSYHYRSEQQYQLQGGGKLVKLILRLDVLVLVIGWAFLPSRSEAQFMPPPVYVPFSEGVSVGAGMSAIDGARDAAGAYENRVPLDAYGQMIRPGQALTPEQAAGLRRPGRGESYPGAGREFTPEMMARQWQQALYEEKKSQYEEEEKAEKVREEFWTRLAEQIERRDLEQPPAEPSVDSVKVTEAEEAKIPDVPIELVAITQSGLVAFVHKSVWDFISILQKGLLEEKFDKVELLKKSE